MQNYDSSTLANRMATNSSAEAWPSPRPKLSLPKKVLFSLVVCATFFAVLEILLAAAGVRRMRYEEDPYVGFTSHIPLYVERPGSGGVMETAANKASWFNPQTFSREKPPGTYRIFCVGGSTTFGRPYDDTTSYCGWLREFLKTADPSQPWEVINAGGISYASYRVALLLEELVQYDPDLVIIYSGHNEFLERRTYSTVIGTPAIVRGLGALLSGTRTFSALNRVIHPPPESKATELSGEVDTILDGSVGLDAYRRDDKLQEQVLAHYRFNLMRMIDISRSVGVGVILVTPASNLRECAPFKSEHRALLTDAEFTQWQTLYERAKTAFEAGNLDKALFAIEQAKAIDDRFAALHYLHGRTLDRLGQYPDAKAALQRARDEDVCPLRALTPMRQIGAEVAAERDVPLVDYCEILEGRSEQGIPGENWFLDHVHPTVEGHRILATALLDRMQSQQIVTPSSSWNDDSMAQVIKTVEGRVDSEAHGRAVLNLSQVLSWAGKHEESGKLALQAVEMIPGNAEAHFFAGCEFAHRNNLKQAQTHFERCLELKPSPRVAVRAHDNLGLVFVQYEKIAEAETQFLKAVEIDPHSARLFNNLGIIALRRNNLSAAARFFENAVSLEPEFSDGHFNLALVRIQQGNPAAASQHLGRVLQLQPNYPGARERLARLRSLFPQGW